MTNLLVSCEGPTHFVATDREPKPVWVRIDCPEGLAAGTDVRLSISTFHSYTRDWRLDDIVISQGQGRFVVGHQLPQDWRQMTRGGDGPAGGGLIGRPINEIYLATLQITQSLTPGSILTFALHVGVSPHAGIEGALLLKLRAPGAEPFEPVGDPMPIPNRPGPPVGLEVRTRAVPDAQGRHNLVVYAADSLLNPVVEHRGSLRLKLMGAGELAPLDIEIGEDGRVTAALSHLKPGPVRIEVEDTRGNLVGRSNPAITPQPGELNHYFGAIHFHTRLSVDGDRDPAQAYAYVRDYLNLDVVAMTDHAPIGARWQECLNVNNAFYAPGRFVTLPAWESSNAFGHANLYLRTPQAECGPWYWNPDVCPSEVEWPDDVVMVPHHTNTGQLLARGEQRTGMEEGRYWTKYDWSIPNPRARLVEVVQGRGNFEADALDEDWGIRLGGQGASIQDALALGWRLGFVAGTDNHEGHPSQKDGVFVGLTCFRASELTREAIWQAMDQRCTYATSGVPIICDFSINGVAAGGETRLARGNSVNFSACIHGTAPVERVEVISQGEIVWSQRPNRWDIEIDHVELPRPLGHSAYYYLRLRQVDGHRAWLSPIWLHTTQGSA